MQTRSLHLEVARRGSQLLLLLIVVGSCILVAGSAMAQPKQLGVATCASSNCHGSVVPRNSSAVLQNEYVTWSKHGSHSRAWKVLLEEDAQKIGEHLGIARPETHDLCLDCHASNIDSSLRSEKFRIEDGVGCEHCHGAAENWLVSHSRVGASHSESVAKGMTDLADLQVRAKLCLSCHYGTDDKSVNHRLLGAGHPRLSFELDTFSMIQPRHWLVESDYIERKGDYNAVRAWLIGQAELATAMLSAFQSPTRSRNGSWPELSLFTCNACHHSLTQDQWKKRHYNSAPGELQLNVSPMRILEQALSVLQPAYGKKLRSDLARLHALYKAGQADSHLESMRTWLAKTVVGIIEATTYDDSLREQLLRRMLTFASTSKHFQYEEAEQIAMAVSSILASKPGLTKKYKHELAAVYASLRNDEDFEAAEFAIATAQFLNDL